MIDKPVVTPQLLAYLKERFAMPRKVEDMSERQIMVARGRDQVVEHFEALASTQEKERAAAHQKG